MDPINSFPFEHRAPYPLSLNIPPKTKPSSSSDLDSNSPLPPERVVSPTEYIIFPEPSLELRDLQTIPIPEYNAENDSSSLPVQNIDLNIPTLDNQASLSSSPVTIINISSPPRNSNPQALRNTAAETEGTPEEDGFVTDAHRMWLQYLLLVGGVSYAAVSAILQALQGTRPLSIASKIVYAALLVSFTIFVVSAYIRTTCPRASVIAVHVGSLFGFAAFFVAFFSSLTRGL